MEKQNFFEDFIYVIRPERAQKEKILQLISKIKTRISSDAQLATADFIVGGPFKRETMIKGDYQADIALVLSRKSLPFKELILKTEHVLKEEFPDTKRIIHNIFQIGQNNLEPDFNSKINVIPSFKVNSPRQLKEVRRQDYYTGTSVKFYTQYINKQKPRYKKFLDAIIMTKHWAKINAIPLHGFQVEYIVCEGMSHTTEFDWYHYFNNIFKAFENMLNGQPLYPVNWDKRFQNDEVNAQKSLKTEILMVDPANPSNNLGAGINESEVALLKQIVKKAIELTEDRNWNELFQV